MTKFVVSGNAVLPPNIVSVSEKEKYIGILYIRRTVMRRKLLLKLFQTTQVNETDLDENGDIPFVREDFAVDRHELLKHHKVLSCRLESCRNFSNHLKKQQQTNNIFRCSETKSSLNFKGNLKEKFKYLPTVRMWQRSELGIGYLNSSKQLANNSNLFLRSFMGVEKSEVGRPFFSRILSNLSDTSAGGSYGFKGRRKLNKSINHVSVRLNYCFLINLNQDVKKQ